jgi:nitroreductase
MIEAIMKRRSVRAFLKKDVEEDKLDEVLLAASFSPTSWGTRAWEFIVVKDPAMKERLSRAAVHAAFVKDAPIVIVLCYDASRGRRFKEDSSICAGYMLLEAVNQGLGSCFVQVADAGEPPGNAEPFVKDLLGIPGEYRVQCMLPMGYPTRALKVHSEGERDPGKVHMERF